MRLLRIKLLLLEAPYHSQSEALLASVIAANIRPVAQRVSLALPPLTERLRSLDEYEAKFMPCEAAFRFTKAEIFRLCIVFGIPDPFITSHRDVFPPWEALALLLRKLSNPVRSSTSTLFLPFFNVPLDGEI